MLNVCRAILLFLKQLLSFFVCIRKIFYQKKKNIKKEVSVGEITQLY